MRAAACVVLLLARCLYGAAQVNVDAEFDAMLAKVQAAQVEFARGRPEPFKALWSHEDDVTLTGGLGGAIEKGWAAVSRRLDWASSQYSEGERTYKEVARHVGADLAYVVLLEMIRFRPPGQPRETTQTLRATMVFRRHAGAWLIVHRHADSATARQAAQE